MAGCAHPTGSAGQALGGAQANPELTFNPDHQLGADQWFGTTLLSSIGCRTAPAIRAKSPSGRLRLGPNATRKLDVAEAALNALAREAAGPT